MKNVELKIVVFIGSPLPQSNLSQNFKTVANELKKHKVLVDVFSFGEHEQNWETLKTIRFNIPKW